MITSVKPDRATWVTPYMTVQDVDVAANFCKDAFGFEILELASGEDGTTWHGELRYKDQLIMMGKQGTYEKEGCSAVSPISSGAPSPINLYIYCEDVDALYERALSHGAVSVMKPDDMFWGDRMCNIKDPQGYTWCFATHKGEHQ